MQFKFISETDLVLSIEHHGINWLWILAEQCHNKEFDYVLDITCYCVSHIHRLTSTHINIHTHSYKSQDVLVSTLINDHQCPAEFFFTSFKPLHTWWFYHRFSLTKLYARLAYHNMQFEMRKQHNEEISSPFCFDLLSTKSQLFYFGRFLEI